VVGAGALQLMLDLSDPQLRSSINSTLAST
jgi:hypothetical protein